MSIIASSRNVTRYLCKLLRKDVVVSRGAVSLLVPLQILRIHKTSRVFHTGLDQASDLLNHRSEMIGMDLKAAIVFFGALDKSARVYWSSTPMKVACALNKTDFRLHERVMTH